MEFKKLKFDRMKEVQSQGKESQLQQPN